MRTKKATNGKVAGVKFSLDKDKEKEEIDLKKVKSQVLKELAEKEENDKEWYDKEMDKNLNKQ